jgi:hypothetical protein
MPEYVGLIGSKRRVQGLFDLLEKEGFFSRELTDRIHNSELPSYRAVTPDESQSPYWPS